MKKRTSGFSLLEIAIVVLVIGVLAAIAIPLFQQATRRSVMSTLENDLRILAQEFQGYELELNEYPPTQLDAGVYPVGMEDRLSHIWLEPCVAGGFYRWTYTTEDNPAQRAAYIEVNGTAERPIRLGVDELQRVDEQLDDGNTATGKLRLYGLNFRFYAQLPKE